MKKKLLTILTAAALTLSIGVTAFADTFNYERLAKSDVRGVPKSELNDNRADWVQKKGDADTAATTLKNDPKVAEVLKQKEEISTQIEVLDEQISDLTIKIEDNKKELESLKVSIDSAEKDVQAAQAEVEKQQKLMDERVRAVYKTGSVGYVSIVLKADGFSDLVGRIEAVNKIVSYDKKVKKDLDDKKKIFDDKKKVLEDKKTKVEKIKADNEAKMVQINKAKEEQKVKLAELNSFMASHDDAYQNAINAISIADSNINTIDSEITRLNNIEAAKKVSNQSSNKPVVSRGNEGSATASQQAVVAYAKEFLGIQYVWGGETPNGFDCSGFVKYVYAHFGIGLPRVSRDQATAGKAVSRDDLQPGDLVFFARPGEPVHHVGMYVGGGQYIHAPRTGDVIKISSLSGRSDYYCARRFI